MRVKFCHITSIILATAALSPFAIMSVMAIGWEKTLGCLLVGLALALISTVLVFATALFQGE